MWKPIDSAPKDGTWILLRGGKTNEEFYPLKASPDNDRPVVAKWLTMDDVDSCNDGWGFCHWDGMWYSLYENPYEWAEIPE